MLVCGTCRTIAAYVCDGFVCDPKLWATGSIDKGEPLSCIPLMNLRCECGGALQLRVAPPRPVQAWHENGAYLVMRGGEPPSAGLYRTLLPHMIGCTFPVTGEPDLMRALCPDYRPRGQQHFLVNKYGGAGCSFLFLPRHYYTLLYHVFVTKVEKGSGGKGLTGKIPALESEDAQMLITYKKAGTLLPYFTECVSQLLSCSDHLAGFNKWALDQVSQMGCLPKLQTDCINHATPSKLLQSMQTLAKYSDLGVEPSEALLRLVTLELARPECTFLTRFGSSTGEIFITLKDKGTKVLGPSTFSQSFGADIFAGFFGDGHANTLKSIGGKSACFAVPIPIDDYRERRRLASCFWIPPYPTPCQCYAGMNELWHPRSRIFVRKGVSTSSQTVSGVSDYGIVLVERSWSGEINALPFLFFSEVLDDKQIIDLSVEVEAYIRTSALELSAAKK
jgi:hypothetical protein